jgi:hypothetical protein
MYDFTPPPTDDGRRWSADAAESELITLSLPGDTALGVPADRDRWQRREDRIIAAYTRQELAWALALAFELKLAGLEDRLEHGLGVLAAHTGCAEAKARQLMQHWRALHADYARFSKRQATIDAHLACAGGDRERSEVEGR